MRKIQKHIFEPVSLLTVENGVLEVAIIPAMNQPNWLVPKTLMLSIEAYQERIRTYLWQSQEVAIYHLIPKDVTPDALIVLEGNTDVHRIALQTKGNIEYKNLRISDVKDAVLPESMVQQMAAVIPSLLENPDNPIDYVYEAVSLDGELYIVPDLDLIAHCLVDLDS